MSDTIGDIGISLNRKRRKISEGGIITNVGSEITKAESAAIDKEIDMTDELARAIEEKAKATGDRGYQCVGDWVPGTPLRVPRKHLEWTHKDVRRRRNAGQPMIPIAKAKYPNGDWEWVLNSADNAAVKMGYACRFCLSWSEPTDGKCKVCSHNLEGILI